MTTIMSIASLSTHDYNIQSNSHYDTNSDTSDGQMESSNTTITTTTSSSSSSNTNNNNSDSNDLNAFVNPSVPPLYFLHNNAFHTAASKTHQTQLYLPSECVAEITSYLTWGDYAKLSTVHSSFATILHDAALTNGISSIWTLTTHLLNGTGGLMVNERLALKYLYFMAGVTTSTTDTTDIHTDIHTVEANNNMELQLETQMVSMPDISSDGITIYKCHDSTIHSFTNNNSNYNQQNCSNNDEHDEDNDEHDNDDNGGFQIPYTPAMIRLAEYHLSQDTSTTSTTTEHNHDESTNDSNNANVEISTVELTNSNDINNTNYSNDSNNTLTTTAESNESNESTTTTTTTTTITPPKLTPNQKAGLTWLQTATHYSSTTASYLLATTYENGIHAIPHNPTLAAKYYLHGAMNGHVNSMAEYALCCELGIGIEINEVDAHDWYASAAEYGHGNSCYSVGEMWEEGKGGVGNGSDTEAVLWYYKGLKLGCTDCAGALERLGDIARIVLPVGYKDLGREVVVQVQVVEEVEVEEEQYECEQEVEMEHVLDSLVGLLDG